MLIYVEYKTANLMLVNATAECLGNSDKFRNFQTVLTYLRTNVPALLPSQMLDMTLPVNYFVIDLIFNIKVYGDRKHYRCNLQQYKLCESHDNAI